MKKSLIPICIFPCTYFTAFCAYKACQVGETLFLRADAPFAVLDLFCYGMLQLVALFVYIALILNVVWVGAEIGPRLAHFYMRCIDEANEECETE